MLNSTQKSTKKQNPYMKYSGMGFQLVAALCLGAWLGDFLDKKMANQTPYFTILLLLLFLAASLFSIIRDLTKEN
jgi:ATP synthase protein I